MIKRYAPLAIIYVLAAVGLNAQNGWVAMEDSLRGTSIASMASDSMGRLYAVVVAKTIEWKVRYASYYNPARDRAVISFATPKAEHVRLELHDLLGEDVATLHNARLETGEHRITLDATGLASGAYLCRLTAGGAVATKVVIVR